MPNVWQIAAGDFGRDYATLFLRHDLMFLGPGRYGAFRAEHYSDLADTGEVTKAEYSRIKAFAEDVRPGDIVLLRRGYRVLGVGLVPDEDYQHDSTFDDVYGWDLEHTRRVVWQDQLKDDLAAAQSATPLFDSRKQIPTFTRVKDRQILDPIQEILASCHTRPLKQPPERVPEPLTPEEIGESLFARGLANSAVDQVQKAIERQRRLLVWYRRFGRASSRPDEHEVVSHMVLPLLLALGWSEQLLAVEWHKIDLAGFSGTPTTAGRCVLVCEAKGLSHGLQSDKQQAIDYVDGLQLQGCRKILLTQGGRFYLYHRFSGGNWPEEPTGYFNVERIRTNHIAPANTDAIDTLMAITPAGIAQPLS